MSQHAASKGMIALSLVLLVGAIVFVAGIGALTRSATTVQNYSLAETRERALAAANACAEYALMQLFEDSNYAGNETVNLSEDSCFVYSLVSPSATTRIIDTSSTVLDATQKVRVEVSSATPPIQVSAWYTVANFE